MIKNSILFIYLLRIMMADKHINVNLLVQNHKSVKTKTNKKKDSESIFKTYFKLLRTELSNVIYYCALFMIAINLLPFHFITCLKYTVICELFVVVVVV